MDGKISHFLDGVRDGIPIGLGYFAVSFAFGMSAASGGMDPFIAGLISLTNLTSAGQFAALGIIFSDGTYTELLLTQLVINLRYALMSFTLSQRIAPDTPFPARMAAAFGITDEIFGVAVSRPYPLSAVFIFGAMSMAVPGWVLGTLSGALLKNLLPGMILSALGIAIYGMFLAIIIPPAVNDRPVAMVVLGAMIFSSALYYLPVLRNISAGFGIIIVTVTVSAVAAILFPVEEEGDQGQT